MPEILNRIFSLPSALLLLCGGCGGTVFEANSNVSSMDSKENAVRAELIESVEYDDKGEVKNIKGLEKSKFISDSNSENVSESSYEHITKNLNNKEPIFKYTPPVGMEAEFSEPIMIAGSHLNLVGTSPADFEQVCSGYSYHKSAPSAKELYDRVLKSQTCGKVDFKFCVRASMLGIKDKLYTHLELPSVPVTIPCRNDSFKDVSVTVNNGNESATSTKVFVKLSSDSNLVKKYSITNNQSCSSDGTWSDLPDKEIEWTLNFVGNPAKATVYVIFQDIFGRTSECHTVSILLHVPEVEIIPDQIIQPEAQAEVVVTQPEQKPVSEYTVDECNALDSSQYLWFTNGCKELASLSVSDCNMLSTLEYLWGPSGTAAGSCQHVASLSESSCQAFESYIWENSQCIARTGASAQVPSKTCKLILDNNFAATDGVYWLDPNAGDSSDAFQAYCDMTTDGGGWTLFASTDGASGSMTVGELTSTSAGAIFDQTRTQELGTSSTQVRINNLSGWKVISIPETHPIQRVRIYQYLHDNISMSSPEMYWTGDIADLVHAGVQAWRGTYLNEIIYQTNNTSGVHIAASQNWSQFWGQPKDNFNVWVR